MSKAWSATGTWEASWWKHPYYGGNGKLRAIDYYTDTNGKLRQYKQLLWKCPATGNLVDRATFERAEYLRQMGVQQ